MDPVPKWEYIVLYIIPLGTIWGNVLVCLAVYLERRLRHRFNLFLVSLAISDLLCALLVMPVSAWQLITGGSSRDRTLCLIWYSMDIFFTATTIIHLCTISLDRYLALRRPFTNHPRTPRIFHSLVIRIFMSWFIPFSIAGPLFLFALQQHEQGLERVDTTRQSTNLATELFAGNATAAVLDPLELTESYKGCGPNDPSFVLTAIGVTFVLPLIIMATTYVLTVRMLRQHMEQIKAIRLYKPISNRMNRSNLKRAQSARTSSQGIKHTPNILLRNLSAREETESHTFSRQSTRVPSRRTSKSDPIPQTGMCDGPDASNGKKASQSTHDRCGANNQEAGAIETKRLVTDHVTDRNNTRDGSFLVIKPIPITQLGSNSNDAQPSIMYHDYPPGSPSHQANVALAHISTFDRIHSAKRAVRVIGVLFALFVTCYLPFFIVYIIDVMCLDCKRWTGVVIPHLEWLGYLSSMLNPVVYHSFNSTFRRTFRRIFRCACRSIPDHHAIWCRRVRI